MNETIIPLIIPLKIPVDADASTDAILVDTILDHLNLRSSYDCETSQEGHLHRELARLLKLRRKAYDVCVCVDTTLCRNVEEKEEKVNDLMQYYCALMDLESRKVCVKFGKEFEFHWTCALTSSMVENYNGRAPVYSGDLLAYERACILFNVVVLNSQYSLFNRLLSFSSDINFDISELKQGKETQFESAMILHRLYEDFSSSYEGTSADLSLLGLQMLEKIMLAEGQVVSLEFAIRSAQTRQDSVKAKIAASAAMLYNNALLLAQRLPSEVSFVNCFVKIIQLSLKVKLINYVISWVKIGLSCYKLML